jgi:hypothetical protein
MADSHVVDSVTGFRIWFFCIKDLLDGKGSHRVFPIVALMATSKSAL